MAKNENAYEFKLSSDLYLQYTIFLILQNTSSNSSKQEFISSIDVSYNR